MRCRLRYAAWLLTLAWLAGAQTVTTLVDHGDAANRIDIVVLSEGYTAGEMSKFAADVNRFVGGFFGAEVYREYAPYFNIRMVAAPSNQSGASHPEKNPAVVRDTAFGASYNCLGVVRLICVNTVKVNAVVTSLLAPNQRDYIFVLVNDATYGGAGGGVLVSSTNELAVEIALHESGHTIGLLADEYTDQPPVCSMSAEPPAANATLSKYAAGLKWSAWIAGGTPVPTTVPALDVPGLYEGSDYCASGKYRPTYNSKMRTLGQPFDAINAEQLVRRFYNLVSGIDGFAPGSAAVTAVQGAYTEFRVTPMAPATHALTVHWTVDGVAQDANTTLTVDTAKLSAGAHTVAAVVRDLTSWVRTDWAGLLTDSQTWQLTVTPEAVTPPALRPAVREVAGAALSTPAVKVLAEGGVFTIFGSDFAAAGVSINGLSTNLAQTCVQVGASRAPVLFVSPEQINAIAPAMPEASTVALSVIAGCGTPNERISAPLAMPVAAAAPEFLYAAETADGHNPVAMIQAANGAIVTSARAGDVLTIFGVGFGATSSTAPAGTVAAAAAETVGKAAMSIGGVVAQVLYAGLTPGYAGLYQVNFVVPDMVEGDLPVNLQVNGGVSPAGAYLHSHAVTPGQLAVSPNSPAAQKRKRQRFRRINVMAMSPWRTP